MRTAGVPRCSHSLASRVALIVTLSASLFVLRLTLPGEATMASAASPADLFVASLSVTPNPATPGTQLSVDYEVLNLGGTKSAQFLTRVYLSIDAHRSPQDQFLTQDYTNPIRPGRGKVLHEAADLSSSLSDGVYYVIVEVDALNATFESNEANNIRAAQISVGVSISPTPPAPRPASGPPPPYSSPSPAATGVPTGTPPSTPTIPPAPSATAASPQPSIPSGAFSIESVICTASIDTPAMPGEDVQCWAEFVGSPATYVWTASGGEPFVSLSPTLNVRYPSIGPYVVKLKACTATNQCDDGEHLVMIRARGAAGRAPERRASRGLVVYIPGISADRVQNGLPDWGEERSAQERAEEFFGPSLRQVFHEYTARYFSYSTAWHESSTYFQKDTRQSLHLSAHLLDEQIDEWTRGWRDDYGSGDPEIVIVAHSLGGAVTAVWASSAPREKSRRVRFVVSFDSPLSGYSVMPAISTESDFGDFGPAGDDLVNASVKRLMAFGVRRMPWQQIRNPNDRVVSTWSPAVTTSWQRSFDTTCSPWYSLPEQSHLCALIDEHALAAVRSGLRWSTAVRASDGGYAKEYQPYRGWHAAICAADRTLESSMSLLDEEYERATANGYYGTGTAAAVLQRAAQAYGAFAVALEQVAPAESEVIVHYLAISYARDIGRIFEMWATNVAYGGIAAGDAFIDSPAVAALADGWDSRLNVHSVECN